MNFTLNQPAPFRKEKCIHILCLPSSVKGQLKKYSLETGLATRVFLAQTNLSMYNKSALEYLYSSILSKSYSIQNMDNSILHSQVRKSLLH